MLGRVEQLKARVKELEQQLQESAREVSCQGPGQAPPQSEGSPQRGPDASCLDGP